MHNSENRKIDKISVGKSSIKSLLLLSFSLLSVSSTQAHTDQHHFVSSDQKNHMVELYTSQGCSSCPPAEERLNEFKRHPDLWRTLFPIAFHVDYWDYLGWKDPYATSQHSQRQRRYARNGNIRSVYTPAFIINGQEAGTKERQRSLSDRPGKLSLVLNETEIRLSYQSQSAQSTVNKQGELVYHVALVGMGLKTHIKRGENRGRFSEHEFVVLAHQTSPAGVVGTEAWMTQLPKRSASAKHPADSYALVAWVSRLGDQTPIQVTGGSVDIHAHQ